MLAIWHGWKCLTDITRNDHTQKQHSWLMRQTTLRERKHGILFNCIYVYSFAAPTATTREHNFSTLGEGITSTPKFQT